MFKISIPLNVEAAIEAKEKNKLSEREKVIFDMIKKNNTLSVEEVMAELSISRAIVFRGYAKVRKITEAVYDRKPGSGSISLNKSISSLMIVSTEI